MTSQKSDAGLFDAYYFKHSCGQPYERNDQWLNFFGGIADSIVRTIAPRTVLDAGCAMGFLVEGLRQRGVEAWGVDVSEYAIERVRPDVKPYCSVASVTKPLERTYDLIVSIEVLEHLNAHEAEQAIENFSQHTGDVLFSSTPFDYKESTHQNVQPVEYWAEMFARYGLFRDVDFDASFVTSWAVRFRRKNEPFHRLVRDYERKFWHLWKENSDLRELTKEMRSQLSAMESAPLNQRAQAVQENRSAPSDKKKSAGDRARKNAVLVLSHEVVGKRMAGPGIRYFNLSHVLSREFDVTLASPFPVEPESLSSMFRTFAYRRKDWSSIESAAQSASVIICPTDIASDFPSLGELGATFVIDGYDPVWAEWLAITQTDLPLQQMHWPQRQSEIHQQYLLGDFFICASERQRDWWLGILEATGRINPWTFHDDPSLRRLIDVVPFGLPEAPPQATRRIVKNVWNGIGDRDRVILWGGGLWLWLDPLTAIRALAQVYKKRQDVRLIFPGTEHPNPIMKAMPTHNDAARNLAKELGLLNRAVFFGDWVPYADWQNVLLESDLALTLHGKETLESRLAFRSRVFDYIWAGLPVVATRGDATSDLIAENGLGIVVENGDAEGVANAILRLLDAPAEYKKRIEQLRPTLTWEHAAQPLIEFCRSPRRAPDKATLKDLFGNPFHESEVEKLRNENERLQSETNRLHTLIHDYERRRAVRIANRLKRLKDR